MVILMYDAENVEFKFSRLRRHLETYLLPQHDLELGVSDKKTRIITHLAGQTYVWHGCKWNFAGPQIYFQPAKIKSQHFGVSLKFLVCN